MWNTFNSLSLDNLDKLLTPNRYKDFCTVKCKSFVLLTSRMMLLESVCAVHVASFRFYTRLATRAWSPWRRDVTSSFAARIHSERGPSHGLSVAAMVTLLWSTSCVLFLQPADLIDPKVVSTMKHNIHQRERQEERQGHWRDANLEVVKNDEALCPVNAVCRVGDVDVMKHWVNRVIDKTQRDTKPAAVDLNRQ